MENFIACTLGTVLGLVLTYCALVTVFAIAIASSEGCAAAFRFFETAITWVLG